MKKIIKLFSILLLLLPFIKVEAANYIEVNLHTKQDTSETENITYKTPVSLGDPEPDSDLRSLGIKDGYYIYYMTTIPYYGKYKGKTVNLTCIDPGLEVNAAKLKCIPLKNAKIKSVLKNDQSVERDLAVRYLAAQAGLTKGKYSMGALRRSGWAGLEERGGTTYIKDAKKLVDNATGVEEPNADKFRFQVKSGTVKSVGGHKIEATITSGAAVRYTPKFKCVSGSGCTGDPVVTWTPGASEGKITFEVDAPDNCSAKFSVKYDATTGGLYLCVPESSDDSLEDIGAVKSGEQRYLGYIPDSDIDAAGGEGDEGDPIVVPGDTNTTEYPYSVTVKLPDDLRHTICSECECDVPDDITSNIHLCCSDAADSSAREPNINEVFCTLTQKCIESNGKIDQIKDKQIKVEGAYDKESGKYKTSDYINSYCQTYCTERVFVSLPGASKGRNGRYFEFTKNSQGGDGPVIKGSVSCRNIIYYNKWLKDYVKETEYAVEAYNSYQQNINSYYAYQDAYDTTNNANSKEVKITATYSDSCTVCPNTAHAKSVTCTGASQTITYTMNYQKHFEESNQRKYSYKQAKIKYTDDISWIHGFKGFKITEGDTADGAQSPTGYYHITWSWGEGNTSAPSADDFDSSHACSSGTVSCQSVANVATTPTDSCTGTANRSVTINVDPDIETSFTNSKNTYSTNAATEKGYYESHIRNLKTLKELLETCDNYYIDGEGNNDDFVKSKFDYNNIQFVWFVAYVNMESVVKKDENTINLTPSCLFKSSGQYGSGVYDIGKILGYTPDTGGIESPHYDEGGVSTATVYNFKNGETDTVNCSSTNRTRTTGINCRANTVATHVGGATSIDQKYTSDNLYYYTCSYTYPNNRKSYTVYPYGGRTLSDTEFVWQYTKHEGREFVQHSTIFGTYETRWENLHLGSNISGNYKFDEEFNYSGETCTKEAKNSVDPSGNINFYCTLQVSSDLVKIQGCPTELPAISSYENSGSYWNQICCNAGYNGGECQKITDDTLTFTFKIADSTKLFPAAKKNDEGKYDSAGAPKDPATGKKYAYNWFSNKRGTQALLNIENTSMNDELYDPSRITYEFELTPNALKAIKNYNATINNYNSITKGRYDKGSQGSTELVKRYYSDFVNAFYTNGSGGKVVLSANGKTFETGVKASTTTARDTARSRVYWDCYGEEDETRCKNYLDKTW